MFKHKIGMVDDDDNDLNLDRSYIIDWDLGWKLLNEELTKKNGWKKTTKQKKKLQITVHQKKYKNIKTTLPVPSLTDMVRIDGIFPGIKKETIKEFCTNFELDY